MIAESWYWKRPLLVMAQRLRRLKSAGALTQRQLAQIERDVFLGFYSVRKLFEAQTKVTDKTKAMAIDLQWHPNSKPVTWRNNHKFDELYDLTTARSETRNIWFICGRIIHSFIFVPCQGERGGLEGIFFTSDTDKNSKLYYLSVDDMIQIFEVVGNDDPVSIDWHGDPDTGEETTRVS